MRGPRPFRLFLMVILALTPLAQSFWFAQAWHVIDAVAWPGLRALLQGLWIVAALVVLAAVLDLLRVRVLPRRGIGPWGRAVARLWLIASCFSFLAMTAVGSLDMGLAASRWQPCRWRTWARVEPARHTVFRYAAYLAGGLPFLAVVYGTTAGRLRVSRRPRRRPARAFTSRAGWTAHRPPERYPYRGLPAPHGPSACRRPEQCRAARSRRADRRSHHRREHDPLEDGIAELSRLQAPLGVWGCHGNHERWAGVEAQAQALFARYGMHLLRQQCVELSWHGGRFNLIGVDDQRERARPGEPSSMLRSIEGLVRRDIPNILLSHNPDTFPRAAALGIELSLAGHTHGGQIRLQLGNRQWSPASSHHAVRGGPVSPAVRPGGASRTRGDGGTPSAIAFLYVNPGLGTFGTPPAPGDATGDHGAHAPSGG